MISDTYSTNCTEKTARKRENIISFKHKCIFNVIDAIVEKVHRDIVLLSSRRPILQLILMCVRVFLFIYCIKQAQASAYTVDNTATDSKWHYY